MLRSKLQTILEQLSDLTLTELSEVKAAIHEEQERQLRGQSANGDLTEEEWQRLETDSLLGCVKMVRERTGLSLVDSKAYVDRARARRTQSKERATEVPPPPADSLTDTAADIPIVVPALVEAYLKRTGWIEPQLRSATFATFHRGLTWLDVPVCAEHFAYPQRCRALLIDLAKIESRSVTEVVNAIEAPHTPAFKACTHAFATPPLFEDSGAGPQRDSKGHTLYCPRECCDTGQWEDRK